MNVDCHAVIVDLQASDIIKGNPLKLHYVTYTLLSLIDTRLESSLFFFSAK